MPSEVVHWALAALVAAALLGDEFDARSLAVVLAVTAVPDLDTFVGMVAVGTHRAALHNLFVPFLAGALLAYDTRVRGRSILRSRYGARGVRIAWVSLFALAFAGIGLDLFYNGVNPFYPVHDRFYRLWGDVLISNQRGFVQTIWETRSAGGGGGGSSVVGTTKTVHYSTGVDPTPRKEPKDVERVFPIVRGGLQTFVVLTALAVTPTRLWLSRNR